MQFFPVGRKIAGGLFQIEKHDHWKSIDEDFRRSFNVFVLIYMFICVSKHLRGEAPASTAFHSPTMMHMCFAISRTGRPERVVLLYLLTGATRREGGNGSEFSIGGTFPFSHLISSRSSACLRFKCYISISTSLRPKRRAKPLLTPRFLCCTQASPQTWKHCPNHIVPDKKSLTGHVVGRSSAQCQGA